MVRKDYAALGETVWRETLHNGLDVFIVPRTEYGKQFAFLVTRYGGMDTRIGDKDGAWFDTPAGTAHYLEHRLFEKEYGQVSELFAQSGASDNAFTAADMTGFYFEGTCDFEKNLKLLLSLVLEPWFSNETVEKERGIIVQEIRMEEDDPYSELYYRTMEMLFSRHPIKTRVAGTINSVSEITAEMLRHCYDAFYCPANMVLCVAGNVDPEAVCNIVREATPDSLTVPIREEYGRGEPLIAVNHYAQWEMPVSTPLFDLGIKCKVADSGKCLRQRFIAELACDVLFGPSSVLYNRLYDEGLINGAFGGDYEYVPGAAYFLISGESRDPACVRDEILKEAERLVREGIDESLWNRLVRASYGAMVRRLNSLEDVCTELVQSHFDGEDYFQFPEVFQSIEKRDVEMLLEQCFDDARCALAVVMPQK